jgi:hypothetical protein
MKFLKLLVDVWYWLLSLLKKVPKMDRQPQKQVVGFFDLLGFRNYIMFDTVNGLRLLQDFHGEVLERIKGSRITITTRNQALNELREASGSDSFDELTPFSDSFFIGSKSPDKFLRQMSTLLVDLFMFSASAYDKRASASEIVQIRTKTPVINANRKVSMEETDEHWYPILLRGGVVYDTAWVAELPALRAGAHLSNYTMVGPGVVRAYDLHEMKFKGPRVVCSGDFVGRLNSKSHRFLLPIKGTDLYDLLWPIARFLDAQPQAEMKSRIAEFIRRTANLWNAFNHLEFGSHYYHFVKLVVVSILKYYEDTPHSDFARRTVVECLKENNLELKQSDLLDTTGI